MHLFLDESGDTGFKFRRGSTQVFVIALVVVDDPSPLNQAVEHIRHQCRLGAGYEFKFSVTADKLKERFFRGIQGHSFYMRAIVIDKTMIYSERLREKHWFWSVRELTPRIWTRLWPITLPARSHESRDRELLAEIARILRQA
jgi:hypothetical protein